MVRAVVISDEAYSLLKRHMHEAGEFDEDETMNELFCQADKVWQVNSKDMVMRWSEFQKSLVADKK